MVPISEEDVRRAIFARVTKELLILILELITRTWNLIAQFHSYQP